MATFQELLAEAKRAIPEVTAPVLRARVEAGEPLIVVDVRDKQEQAEGRVPGALPIPRGMLELKIEAAVPDRAASLVLYCGGGTRSLLAAQTLRQMGYASVTSLAGGYAGWTREGFPTERAPGLTEAQRRRYARHLAIPEVGEAGQAKLLASRVLVVGAGGLGSPAAYYLAAAGVGRLGIVDFDVVEESNLQRQILHSPSRVGQKKTESAKRTLAEFNPGIEVRTYDERLTAENAERLLAGWDLVLDGSDNFATRYLVNDTAVRLGLPCVHGSVYRFEGQVMLIDRKAGGPCYRCLYPEPPPPERAPSCAEAGVLGVLPGVIGLLQAIEAVKWVLAIGEPLRGKVLTYDALSCRMRVLGLERVAGCAGCG